MKCCETKIHSLSSVIEKRHSHMVALEGQILKGLI
jgi:hypothetical protein